jgi:hypothetical protein
MALFGCPECLFGTASRSGGYINGENTTLAMDASIKDRPFWNIKETTNLKRRRRPE